MRTSIAEVALPWLWVLYCAASLLHFVHNAEYLADYPNMPFWLSRVDVYLAWVCVAAVGAFGYVLYGLRRRISGLVVLAIYAGLGFDGLLHYTRAPIGAHTWAMNLTIWFEVAAAGLLLVAVASLGTCQTPARRI